MSPFYLLLLGVYAQMCCDHPHVLVLPFLFFSKLSRSMITWRKREEGEQAHEGGHSASVQTTAQKGSEQAQNCTACAYGECYAVDIT